MPFSIVGLVAVLALLASSGKLDAQQVTVLKNVNVIDGTSAAAKPNKTVVIKGDRIRSIGPGQADTPTDVKAIDMHGQTILPLIINTRGHLGMAKLSQELQAFTGRERRHNMTRRPVRALPW